MSTFKGKLLPRRRRVMSSKPSRAGCRTCRIRKVRCDESRPKCRKCVSTGRNCDGYDVVALDSGQRNGISHRPLLPLARGHPSPISLTLSRPTQMQASTTDQERLAYEFFLRQTASVIWHTAPAKQWVRTALQLVTSEEAIFYAVTAVGSVHRAQRNFYHQSLTQPGLPEESAGLQQYCKATASLQRYIDGAGSNKCRLEPILLCCLLFVCFETFQNRGDSALAHLHFGRRLLGRVDGCDGKAVSSSACNAAQTVQNELFTMLDRLEMQVTTAFPIFSVHQDCETTLTSPTINLPNCFASVQAASKSLWTLIAATERFRLELVRRGTKLIQKGDDSLRHAVKYCIANCLSRTTNIAHESTLRRREYELRRAHEVWLELFNDLKLQSTVTGSPILTLIEVQHLISQRSLQTCYDIREEQMDRFDDDNIRVLNLIERFLSQATTVQDKSAASPFEASVIGPEPQRSFSLVTAILSTLYHICLKCRSSSIRNRALNLLNSADRREGMHYSRQLADRAADLIKLEEDKAREILGVEELEGCKIPESARIADVVVESLSPFETAVICTRFRYEQDGRLEVREYRRFRRPEIDPEPVWQAVLDYGC